MVGSSLFRRTPVSLLNLCAQPARAVVSIGGVSFALLLIFMQLGFRGAVGNTAVIVYGKLKGDIVMRSLDYVHLYEPKTIDRAWMEIVASHPNVASVDPFFIMLQRWQNPPRNESCESAPPDGSFRTVGMMAMELDRPVIDLPDLTPLLEQIKDPDALLIDSATRAEYGPQNCKRFSDQDISFFAELGGRSTRIAGVFKLGTGLATNGAVLISDVGFSRRSPVDTQRRASLGLVRLRPNVDAESTRRELEDWLMERDSHAAMSVQLLTMDEQKKWERRRWLNETPIGMIFTMGVLLSFIIGAAIVYMVLATDVTSRISEFATMKAMGYSEWFVAGIVLRQAWILALAGYVISALCAEVLYRVTVGLSGIPTFMTWERMLGVAAMAVVMCTFSGLLAIRSLWRADPATLF
ncbi:MAG: FtsX-like permease family protein [Planctomycetes bacterium]|nr:FtsX-like permease family protein [Planctomycetota bacterium]